VRNGELQSNFVMRPSESKKGKGIKKNPNNVFPDLIQHKLKLA